MISLCSYIPKGFGAPAGHENQIRVFSVSTDPIKHNHERRSSIEGGTYVYVRGIGFSHVSPINNEVRIGGYPCIIKGRFRI
jgi:hypothetical protein